MPRRKGSPKPLGRKLKQREFYCVKCRKPVTASASDICVRKPRRAKSPMMTAYCSKCDCNLNKFIKKSVASNMTRKYGKC